MHRPYAAYGHPHFCEQEEALACVLVKLEKSYPFGSVKDRAALYIIRELEKAGRLTPGGCIVEPPAATQAWAWLPLERAAATVWCLPCRRR